MRGKVHQTLDAQALCVLCEQLLLLVQAGMPLHEGVDALCAEYDGTPFQQAFAQMNAQMKDGKTLADAMDAAGIFPSWMAGMVRAGEQSGEMERMLRELAAYFARAHQLRCAVADAVRYPLTLMAIMLLVLLALIFYVLPVFSQAFGTLGQADGWGAGMLLVSKRVGLTLLALMVILMGLAAALYTARPGSRREKLRAWLLGRLPALARLQTMMAAQKFASVMGMLLASGFPMETAMEILPDVYDSPEEKQRIRRCASQLLEGETFSAAVGNMRIFESLYLRILHVGFAGGQMDAAFSKVAQLLSDEIDVRLARMVSRIEPALVIFLGTMIGALLLCVLSPLGGVLGTMA